MSAADWTPARVEMMRRLLLLHGKSASQIAYDLNTMTGSRFSRNAVIGKIQRCGWVLPQGTVRERVRQAKALAAHTRFAPKKQKQPKAKAPAPPVMTRGPKRGPHSVRFIDRTLSQCPMFCEGEEGPTGFVCGAPVVFGSWCALCGSRVFDLNALRRNKSGKAA